MNPPKTRLLSLVLLASLGCGELEEGPVQVQRDAAELIGIRAETLTLQARGDEADLYFAPVPARLRPRFRDRFPIVVVLQGALVPRSAYSELARRVARQGFVVVVPDRFQTLVPGEGPQLFTDQLVLLDALAELERLDRDRGSPLFEIVDTSRSAVVGHSFGGAVGLFNIDGRCQPPLCFGVYQRPASLRGGVFYGTNTVQDGFVLDVDTTAAPVALIQGSLDGVSTPDEGGATFDQALDPTKVLIVVEGANHFGLTDTNLVPGSIPDPQSQTLSQPESIRRIARWTGRALRAFVKDDPWAEFWIFQSGGSFDGTVTVTAIRAD